MKYEIRKIESETELEHHGIMGQQWGIRRFQNKDGSLTDAGRKRYGSLKDNLSKWKVRVNSKISEAKQSYEEAIETKKKKLIERGSPKQIQKNIKLFNSEEMAIIERRFSTELKVSEEIKRLTNSDIAKRPVESVSSSKQFTDATKFISDNTKNMEATVSNAIKAYNSVARAHNALRPNDNPMTLIPEKAPKENSGGDGDGGS